MSKALATLLLLVGCWLVGAAQAQSSLVFVQGLRLWQSPDSLRLVFDLSAPGRYSAFNLQSPNRLVIDLEQGFSTVDLTKLPINKSWISKAYTEKAPNGNMVRFVFELKRKLEPRSFLLTPNQRYGHRLVFDLMDDAPVTTPVAETRKTMKGPEVPRPLDPNRPFVVAVDAGHGGEDPGAIGSDGSHEKHITLAIARRLVREINQTPGMKAFLTRDGDYFIPLAERSALARRQGADIFVSVHADSVANPVARGASVWVLSQNGATSEMGRWLENKENSSDELGGVGGVSLKRKDKVLSEVLLDLSMTHSLNASMDFGRHVLSELGNTTVLHKRDLQRAGFKVLKSPDIPSILVETSFISNPAEARKLQDPLFQQRLAESIHTGIRNYANQNRRMVAKKTLKPATPEPVKPSAPVNTVVASPPTAVNQPSKTSPPLSSHGRPLSSRPQPVAVVSKSTATARVGVPERLAKAEPALPLPVNGRAGGESTEASELLADGRYRVQPGDTLHSIARQFKLKPVQLMQINALSSEAIKSGQKLKIRQ